MQARAAEHLGFHLETRSKTLRIRPGKFPAPGHQKNTAKGPGHSESAPGQQTTGSATAKKKY